MAVLPTALLGDHRTHAVRTPPRFLKVLEPRSSRTLPVTDVHRVARRTVRARRRRGINMTHRTLVAAAALGAMVIGGCAGAPTTAPSPTAVTASPTVTPTPSLSPEEQKLQDAKARVVLLWKTIDGLLSDPSRSINELDPMVGGDALTSLQLMVTQTEQAGEVQVGSSVVASQSAVNQGDSWIVTSCIDRSGATFVKSGTTVTASPAPRLSHEDSRAAFRPSGERATRAAASTGAGTG